MLIIRRLLWLLLHSVLRLLRPHQEDYSYITIILRRQLYSTILRKQLYCIPTILRMLYFYIENSIMVISRKCLYPSYILRGKQLYDGYIKKKSLLQLHRAKKNSYILYISRRCLYHGYIEKKIAISRLYRNQNLHQIPLPLRSALIRVLTPKRSRRMIAICCSFALCKEVQMPLRQVRSIPSLFQNVFNFTEYEHNSNGRSEERSLMALNCSK